MTDRSLDQPITFQNNGTKCIAEYLIMNFIARSEEGLAENGWMMLKIGVTLMYILSARWLRIDWTCCEECIGHQRALSPWTDDDDDYDEGNSKRYSFDGHEPDYTKFWEIIGQLSAYPTLHYRGCGTRCQLGSFC